ncbi:MAG: CBS domain-containing protein [Deltaproteobacteria bacterium]|nr:CBS domain-containing protein [Deltaproteobacteria bacterium]MBW2304043.1 CBS domain-containing protein [Deltaproteobacteria bacterium]
MRTIRVKELMVPLSEYATVSEDANLYEAVMALEKAQAEFDQSRYRHRAVLVYDKEGKIVGKLSQHDIIRALEPRYGEIAEAKSIPRWGGFSKSFIKSMVEHYKLWDKPLNDICRKAVELKVKDIMYTPTEGEFVDQDATLNEALHQLIMGHHQSLLVTKGRDIVGILRLTDVFKEVCDAIKTCDL